MEEGLGTEGGEEDSGPNRPQGAEGQEQAGADLRDQALTPD